MSLGHRLKALSVTVDNIAILNEQRCPKAKRVVNYLCKTIKKNAKSFANMVRMMKILHMHMNNSGTCGRHLCIKDINV